MAYFQSFAYIASKLTHQELLEWAQHKYPETTFDPTNTHRGTISTLMGLNNKNACTEEAKEELKEIYFFRTGEDLDARRRRTVRRYDQEHGIPVKRQACMARR